MIDKYLLFKKTLIFAVIILIFLVVVTFLFFQGQVQQPLTGGDSVVFECPMTVEDRRGAKDCFNIYFEQQLEEQLSIRGEEGIPDHVLELFEEVDETQIDSDNDGNWIIIKDGYGTPYYIKNGVIMYMHG